MVFIGAGAWALAFVPGMLLNEWTSGSIDERNKLLGVAAQIVLFGLGGIIAVIGVGLSLARHGQALLDAEAQSNREATRHSEFNEQITLERDRETARLQEVADQRTTELERDLRARFVPAVELLSAREAVKRTAGLHALAALGNDWLAFGNPGELQVCIDVMCGYLRSATDEEDRNPTEALVRLTGYELIRDHLRPGDDGGTPRWQGRSFPLAQAPIWFTMHLDGIVVADGTVIDLTGASLTDGARINFTRMAIRSGGRIELRSALLTDRSIVRLYEVTVSGGALSLQGARLDTDAEITGRQIDVTVRGRLSIAFCRLRDRARLSLSNVRVSDEGSVGGMRVDLSGAAQVLLDRVSAVSLGRIHLPNLLMSAESRLRMHSMRIEGGALSFARAQLKDESRISLLGARFGSADSVNLSGLVAHDDAVVNVGGAEFSERSLMLPNRVIVGDAVGPLPHGARIAHDSITLLAPSTDDGSVGSTEASDDPLDNARHD